MRSADHLVLTNQLPGLAHPCAIDARSRTARRLFRSPHVPVRDVFRPVPFVTAPSCQRFNLAQCRKRPDPSVPEAGMTRYNARVQRVSPTPRPTQKSVQSGTNA